MINGSPLSPVLPLAPISMASNHVRCIHPTQTSNGIL